MYFDAADDPLGNSVKARGMDRRFNFAQQHPGSSFGPLPDPKWEGFFQALDEAGVDNVADNSVGVRRGMFSPSAPYQPTFDPRFQDSAVADTMQTKNGFKVAPKPSQHIGAEPQSLQALYKLTRGK